MHHRIPALPSVPLCAAVVLVLVGRAHAQTTLGFRCITHNAPDSCAAGELQLSIEIGEDQGAARFLVRNFGSERCSLATIFIDDDAALLGPATVLNGPGVSMIEGPGTPPDLPGGAPFGFGAERRFAATEPLPFRGVNPGEHVELRFALPEGVEFAQVLAALGTESLRMGGHVIAFGNNRSESFISNPPCRADYDRNGLVDSGDLFVFLPDLFAGEPAADLTGDGLVNSHDALQFFQMFVAGCGRG